jgi:hypothetical protein
MKRYTTSARASTLVLLASFVAALGMYFGGAAISELDRAEDPTVTGSGETTKRLPAGTPGFSIDGYANRPLVPGSRVPVNLRLTSTMNVDLRVDRLTVTVTNVREAGLRSTCRPADFVVRPARLRRPVRLDSDTEVTLRSLQLPRWRWPRIGLLDLPVNQDDCKNVTVTLRFDGSARRVPL